tara:strand:+ start:75 stop:1544 length:1470 start_codon:yes stop_codon:yes gene_type:complete
MDESDNMTTPIEMRLSEVNGMPSPQMDLSYVVAIPNNGAVFSQNNEVRIPLNVPTDCFVDLKRAYLKYKISAVSNPIFLDPLIGGASVIENWRVVGGTGQLLEEVIHYNNFYAVMKANDNDYHRASVGHLGDGCSVRPAQALNYVDNNGADAAMVSKNLVKIAAGESRNITHKPQSAFFNADRYMPLGFSTGSTYLSITLSQDATATISSTAGNGTYTASEWELHLPILRPSNEFAQMFRSAMSSGVPVQIHSVGAQNTQQTITSTGTGDQTLTFSTRKRSVKSLITSLRLNSTITTPTASSISSFVNCNISQYNYSVGGMRVPAQPLAVSTAVNGLNAGEIMSQQQLSLGHFNSNLRGICCMDNVGLTDYTLAQALTTNVAGTYTQNAVVNVSIPLDLKSTSTYFGTDGQNEATGKESSKCQFAIDLESYNASFAGMNLSGQGLPVVLHAQVGANGANSLGAVLCDMYIIHDVVFVLDGTTGTFTANS